MFSLIVRLYAIYSEFILNGSILCLQTPITLLGLSLFFTRTVCSLMHEVRVISDRLASAFQK